VFHLASKVRWYDSSSAERQRQLGAVAGLGRVHVCGRRLREKLIVIVAHLLVARGARSRDPPATPTHSLIHRLLPYIAALALRTHCERLHYITPVSGVQLFIDLRCVSDKRSAIAEIARVLFVNPDRGVVENDILDANGVDFLWYHDVVVAWSEPGSGTLWYPAVSQQRDVMMPELVHFSVPRRQSRYHNKPQASTYCVV